MSLCYTQAWNNLIKVIWNWLCDRKKSASGLGSVTDLSSLLELDPWRNCQFCTQELGLLVPGTITEMPHLHDWFSHGHDGRGPWSLSAAERSPLLTWALDHDCSDRHDEALAHRVLEAAVDLECSSTSPGSPGRTRTVAPETAMAWVAVTVSRRAPWHRTPPGYPTQPRTAALLSMLLQRLHVRWRWSLTPAGDHVRLRNVMYDSCTRLNRLAWLESANRRRRRRHQTASRPLVLNSLSVLHVCRLTLWRCVRLPRSRRSLLGCRPELITALEVLVRDDSIPRHPCLNKPSCTACHANSVSRELGSVVERVEHGTTHPSPSETADNMPHGVEDDVEAASTQNNRGPADQINWTAQDLAAASSCSLSTTWPDARLTLLACHAVHDGLFKHGWREMESAFPWDFPAQCLIVKSYSSSSSSHLAFCPIKVIVVDLNWPRQILPHKAIVVLYHACPELNPICFWPQVNFPGRLPNDPCSDMAICTNNIMVW